MTSLAVTAKSSAVTPIPTTDGGGSAAPFVEFVVESAARVAVLVIVVLPLVVIFALELVVDDAEQSMLAQSDALAVKLASPGARDAGHLVHDPVPGLSPLAARIAELLAVGLAIAVRVERAELQGPLEVRSHENRTKRVA